MNTCEHCQEPFEPGRYSAQRFCSKKCNDAKRHASRPGFHAAPAECARCEAPFTARKASSKYCSTSCRQKAAYRARVGFPPPRPCNFCGAVFAPQILKRGTAPGYCSDFCRSKAPVLSSYNITGARLFDMLEAQGGQCATGCGTALSLMVPRGHPKAVHVDHDHACCATGSCGNCVRGLLCPPCNQALGWIELAPNPIARCFAVADYLTRTTRTKEFA